MYKRQEGHFSGDGKRFAIVASRWNDFFTQHLVDGAVDTLVRHGAADSDVTLVKCPGAFELPQVAQRLAASNNYDAVLCLGVLVRGATPHFDYISSVAARGISDAGTATGTPVLFGVLTCDTLEQAMERSGTKAGNKGAEVAMAALEMANLFAQLP